MKLSLHFLFYFIIADEVAVQTSEHSLEARPITNEDVSSDQRWVLIAVIFCILNTNYMICI